MELFIENIGKYIFDTAALRNIQLNTSKEEKKALKDIRYWNNHKLRVQDNCYEQKIQTQIKKSSFNQLEEGSSKKFEIQINNWVPKWHKKKVLNDKWKSYITPHNLRP